VTSAAALGSGAFSSVGTGASYSLRNYATACAQAGGRAEAAIANLREIATVGAAVCRGPTFAHWSANEVATGGDDHGDERVPFALQENGSDADKRHDGAGSGIGVHTPGGDERKTVGLGGLGQSSTTETARRRLQRALHRVESEHIPIPSGLSFFTIKSCRAYRRSAGGLFSGPEHAAFGNRLSGASGTE